MALTATYGALLKRYMNEDIFNNGFTKLSYIWANCEKDKSWRGGTYEVPIEEAGFSSMAYGALTADTDIGEMDVALGTASMVELTGSILVRESDLYRHGDMEQSYLKIMPDKLEEFLKFMQQSVSSQFLQGSYLAKATSNGVNDGTIIVDKPHMFRNGMKVAVDDDNSSEATGYVRSINLATKTLLIYDARTGGAVVDLSGYTTAQNAIVRIIGTGSEKFLSLPEALLSAANGGSDSLYGKTKTSYTSLQALSASGSAWTAATVVDDILKAYYDFSDIRGPDSFKDILVSYGTFKNIAKLLETGKRATIVDKKAGVGFNSIDIVGAEGQAKIVALRDMPNDKVYFGDVTKIKFAGAEPFKKKLYDGNEFFMKRGTTGPEMISDIMLRGNFFVKPAQWGCVYSVASDVSA
jgi:hypothetical protein